MNDKKLIYLASPYTHNDKRVMEYNYQKALEASAEIFNKGYFAYSPIVNCHEMAKQYTLPTDFGFWQEFDFLMMSKCNELYVLKLEGWEVSKGVRAEIDYARKNGMTIYYIEGDE